MLSGDSLSAVRRAILPEESRPFHPSAHVPALDGVRGLAILLVLCYDCLKISAEGNPLALLVRKAASSGWIGVDLFFVLSGFLITGILLETVGKRGYWSSFVIRRSVRIFPLYYITLLGVFLLLPWLLAYFPASSFSENLQALRTQQGWYWLYGQNWLFALQGAWPEERILNHFWSLAVEEQFYLVWPLVVYFVRGRALAWLCVGLCATALGLRYWLLSEGAPPVVLHVMTCTRMDSLAAGALLAIGVSNPDWQKRWLRWFPLAAGIYLIAFLGADAVYPLLKSESFGAYSIGLSAIALMFVLLIGTVLALPEKHVLVRIFSFRFLRTLGKYSYAIYVFHRAVYYGWLELDWSFLPVALQGWVIFVLTLIGSYIVARISWVLIEAPFLALKKYAPRPTDDAGKEVLPSSKKLGWQTTP